MSDPQIFLGGSFRFEVSRDRLVATLQAEPNTVISPTEVLAKLKEIGIKGVDDGAVIGDVQNRKSGALALVVARGKPAVDERPGKVELRMPVASQENGLVARVIPGQLIATVGPVVPGTDGSDVFGAVIPHKKSAPFQIGTGVALVKGSLTATIVGNARISAGIVSVHPLMEIYGDDESAKPEVDFAGDVAIKGLLRDGRTLHTGGCLVVGGAIEAANFKVEGWAHIKGGVVAREKAAGVVGGDLWCRFASGARLVVGGDVFIQSEIAHSKIACGGKLTITGGPIIGGEVAANGGINCKALGNSAGVKTIVEAGTDETLRSLITESKTQLELERKRIKEIREKIAPLMKNLKALTAQQKERCTELLYEADEMESDINKKMIEMTDRCKIAAGKSKAEILVGETIFPGVIIRLPGVEAMVETAITGPVRIRLQNAGHEPKVAVEDQEGSAFILPGTMVVDHFRMFVERLAHTSKAA